MGVDSVHNEIFARLETMTTINWFEYAVPDSENIPPGVYGIATPSAPVQTEVGRGITGVRDDPLMGYELIQVVAPTVDALKIQSTAVVDCLHGFEPVNTTALNLSIARGYEPVTSKFKPTLISRHMVFTFMTNLNIN